MLRTFAARYGSKELQPPRSARHRVSFNWKLA
ncbi:hypothetical protein SAMN06269173_1181, partial [Hymenobacter mucosus]